MQTYTIISFEERVQAQAFWMGQVFDHDLSLENKNRLKQYVVTSRSLNEDMYAQIIISDRSIDKPIITREILTNVLNLIINNIPTSLDEGTNKPLRLNGPNDLWYVTLGCAHVPQDFTEKINMIKDKQHELLVIVAENTRNECVFVLDFEETTLPK